MKLKSLYTTKETVNQLVIVQKINVLNYERDNHIPPSHHHKPQEPFQKRKAGRF